jgi:hypothetical protein
MKKATAPSNAEESDRANRWASDLVALKVAKHEKFFVRTKNPYFAIEAIAESRYAGCQIPTWALEPLLESVAAAHLTCSLGGPLSIDKELGIKTGPGKQPIRRKADRDVLEDEILEFVDALYLSFDVSIERACEITHATADSKAIAAFKQGDEITAALQIHNDETLLVSDLPQDALRIVRKMNAYLCEFKAQQDRNRATIESATRGHSIGYSVETLIDRAHRNSVRRNSIESGTTQERNLFLTGRRMLNRPGFCVLQPQEKGLPSAVRDLPKRVAFADFCNWLDRCAELMGDRLPAVFK